jgi:TonB-linked SusC/RagA family outer membrane protein
MKFKLLLLMILALGPAVSRAQAPLLQVTGAIHDEDGKPLEGVSVREVSTKRGTATDVQGRFTLKVKDGNAMLEVSYVGFGTRRIKLDGKSTLDISLKADTRGKLQDVVVVGTQTQSRRNTTAAISSVSGNEIANMPVASVDAALQGRVAGLNVQISSGEPGVTPTVVVRGNTRINTNIGTDQNVSQAQSMSGPLYVIDGVPVSPDDISAANGDLTGTNYLAGINLNDIESIDIQKDAVATAAWGSRGANGVIYIKTRRGRSARPEFRVNMYGGVTIVPPLLSTVSGAQERAQKMDILRQYGTPAQMAALPQMLTDSLNPYYNNATDWQGIFYRAGATKNVDVTMSAATDKVNYRVSLNYYNEKGIITDFGYQRYSARGNFDFKINDKLNSQLIVSMSKGDRQRGTKFYGNADANTPFDGTSQPSSLYHLTAYDSSTYLGAYSNQRNKNIDDEYMVSLGLNYTIFPFLKYSFQGAADIIASSKDYFKPSNAEQVALAGAGGIPTAAQVESDKSTYSTYFLTNNLNFSKTLERGKHSQTFAVTLSQQFNADVSNFTQVGGNNTFSDVIQTANAIPQPDYYGYSNYQADGTLSYVGQVQYDLDHRYLLYGAYRADASSRFGNDSKWGYFPALGAGWIVSDEHFMDGLKNYVSFFKIRGSYGISGSQSSDFYAPYNSYAVNGTYNGNAATAPNYTNGLDKDNLTWAKTTQKDIGFESQFLKSRISLTMDFYDKVSRDDYFNFALPFYTGFQSLTFNAHDLWIDNRGVDVTLGAHILKNTPLKWHTQLTLSYNKNAIAKLPNNNRTFTIDDWYGVTRVFQVGQPIYEMFQMKYAGVYNNASQIPFNNITGNKITYFKGNHTVQPGDPIWVDVNHIGDVWSDEDNGNQYGDLIPAGDPNPKFTGGWVNDFTYKNFSLSILSVFTWKRTIVNTFFQEQMNSLAGNGTYSFASSRLPDLRGIDYWTPAKAAGKQSYQANFPSINPFEGYYYQFFPFSTMFNEDGSYFKIKNVLLAYDLPNNLVKRAKVNGVRVYGMVDEVYTFKKANIPNPEGVDQLGVYTGGLYPVPTKVTFGLDIQF